MKKELPQLTSDFSTVVQFNEYQKKHADAEHPSLSAAVETGVDILSGKLIGKNVENVFQVSSVLRPAADATASWSEQRLREQEALRSRFPEHQQVVFAGDDDHLYQALGTSKLVQGIDDLGQRCEHGKRSLSEVVNRSLGFDTGAGKKEYKPVSSLSIPPPVPRPKHQVKEPKASVGIKVAGGSVAAMTTLATTPITLGVGALILGGTIFLQQKQEKRRETSFKHTQQEIKVVSQQQSNLFNEINNLNQVFEKADTLEKLQALQPQAIELEKQIKIIHDSINKNKDKLKGRKKHHKIDKKLGKDYRHYYNQTLQELEQAKNILKMITDQSKERALKLTQPPEKKPVEEPAIPKQKSTNSTEAASSTLTDTILDGIQLGSNMFNLFTQVSQQRDRSKSLDTLPVPNV